jgi:large subunit ribosomal protein L22
MEVTAKLRYLRQSPRKVRLVTDLIRGLETKQALNQLKFINKRASRPITKLIQSAIANAEHNFSLNPESLYIKTIFVDQGPTLKRWRARAFGRSAQIRKRTSHITVILCSKTSSKTISQVKPIQSSKSDIRAIKKLTNIAELKKQGKEEGSLKIMENVKKGKVKTGKGFIPKIFRRKAG